MDLRDRDGGVFQGKRVMSAMGEETGQRLYGERGGGIFLGKKKWTSAVREEMA